MPSIIYRKMVISGVSNFVELNSLLPFPYTDVTMNEYQMEFLSKEPLSAYISKFYPDLGYAIVFKNKKLAYKLTKKYIKYHLRKMGSLKWEGEKNNLKSNLKFLLFGGTIVDSNEEQEFIPYVEKVYKNGIGKLYRFNTMDGQGADFIRSKIKVNMLIAEA